MRNRMCLSGGQRRHCGSAMPCWISHGAGGGLDGAGELGHEAIAHALEDAAVMALRRGADEIRHVLVH